MAVFKPLRIGAGVPFPRRPYSCSRSYNSQAPAVAKMKRHAATVSVDGLSDVTKRNTASQTLARICTLNPTTLSQYGTIIFLSFLK
jgi:hypothetical protein